MVTTASRWFHHANPISDGTDFDSGNAGIGQPGRIVCPQIQPAEPIARIVRPGVAMRAGWTNVNPRLTLIQFFPHPVIREN
jgi:hypothetical protein